MKKATKFVTLLLVAVISCLAFAGCKNKNKEVNFNDDPNEKVNLVMWVPTAGGLAPSDNDKVLARVNEYLGSVLPNTTLTIKYEDTNSFGAVMTRMFGAEEAFDICFTSFGTNSYKGRLHLFRLLEGYCRGNKRFKRRTVFLALSHA